MKKTNKIKNNPRTCWENQFCLVEKAKFLTIFNIFTKSMFMKKTRKIKNNPRTCCKT